ncbi:MAG TPA: CaiB/BaiF CoA-transferase family protein [Ktedonobacterales bacterium]
MQDPQALSLAGELPLAGLRILDLTRLLPGGYATQMLADLGADVLKIEEPGAGDYSRHTPPLVHGVGQAFLAVNRNKRSAALNLKHPAGREALLRLVDRVDVLVESFRPGVMDRLGLGYDSLRARNLRLVICTITGYGQNGPYRDRPGHDLNYIGYAGLLAHLRRPGAPPALPGAQLADIAGGGLMAVVGILAALVGRTATGQGRVVDVSMLDGSLALLPLLASNVLNGQGEAAPEEFILNGWLPGYNIYQTADGRFVTVGALEPKFWAELCTRLGRPDLIAFQFPADAAERAATMDELASIFRTKSRDEWVAQLGGTDACVGPLNTLEEALADPQVRARAVAFPVSYSGEPGEGLRTTPLISEAPVAQRMELSGLGQHTAEALAAAGYTPGEIAALSREGAIAVGESAAETSTPA